MSPWSKTLSVLVSASAIALSAVTASGVVLVTDGQPTCAIVLKKPAEPPRDRRGRPVKSGDERAAETLAEWIAKITDAKLPITETPPAEGPAIYVGRAAVEAGLPLDDIASPSREGLRVRSDGNRVLLAGQNDTSTLKAACRFLEELGCRYVMDHPIGEVFPRKRTLAVGPLDITEKPALLMRSIWGSGWSGESLWKVWNGAGGVRLGTAHSWGGYIGKKMFAERPDFFPLRDGKRIESEWLCTTNPDLRRLFTERVIAAIANGDTHPSVSPPDGRTYCQCPACTAQDDPNSIEPSSGSINMTNRYMDFLDAVAREVAKVHPASILGFYCYADYTQPPSNGRKLSPNLCAWIAPIRYSRYHRIGSPNSPSRQQLMEVVQGWRAVADKIAYRAYNYNLAECLVPFSMTSIWKHDIPWLTRQGCIGFNLESLANWEIYGPHMYLSIRLAYDPGADADAIMEDYFRAAYGPDAAPPMKAYWTRIDEAYAGMKCESGSFYAIPLIYTPAFLRELRGYLDAATKAAKDERQAACVAAAEHGWRNADEYMQVLAAMNRGDFAGASVLYQALFTRNEAEQKKRLGNHYTTGYLTRFLGKLIEAGVAATAAPNRVVSVLPDQMRFAWDPEDKGVEAGYSAEAFDDAAWRAVATCSATLNAQGLPDRKEILWYRAAFEAPRTDRKLALFFTEVDGMSAKVFLNGREIAFVEKEMRRRPFEVDLSPAVRAGRNVLAVRVDHTSITELSLGGIIRPVLLIEKGD